MAGLGDMVDKAKQAAADGVDKAKGAMAEHGDTIDGAVDKAADAAQKVAPDSIDPHIESAAQKAKDAT